MSKISKEPCPVCGSDKFSYIRFSSPEPLSVCIHEGSIDLECCNNCGVVRATKESLDFRLGGNHGGK